MNQSTTASNRDFTMLHIGMYESAPFLISRVNADNWVLLQDENGDGYMTWCQSFRTLRDAKHAANSIEVTP